MQCTAPIAKGGRLLLEKSGKTVNITQLQLEQVWQYRRPPVLLIASLQRTPPSLHLIVIEGCLQLILIVRGQD